MRDREDWVVGRPNLVWVLAEVELEVVDVTIFPVEDGKDRVSELYSDEAVLVEVAVVLVDEGCLREVTWFRGWSNETLCSAHGVSDVILVVLELEVT